MSASPGVRWLAWLAHPACRPVLVWAWPAAAACAVLALSTGWFWRADWVALFIPGLPFVAWAVAGVVAWARASTVPWLGVARAWVQAHVAAALLVEGVSLVFAERWLMLSSGWPTGAAAVGGIGAVYLFGTAFLAPWAHAFVASAIAGLHRGPLSRRVERVLAVGFALWLALGGVASLMLSA